MTREEFERQGAAMRANLAADLRGRGFPLAAAIVEGAELGVIDRGLNEAVIRRLTEDQAAAALELGDYVVVWRSAT